jgi:UPF0755 protein
MKKIILIIFLLIIFTSTAFILLVFSNYNAKIEKDNPTIIEIEYGTSMDNIVELFGKEGYFQPVWVYQQLFKYTAKTKKKYILAGVYEIPNSISNKELIDKLFTNKLIKQNKLQIIEGMNIYQIGEVLNREFKINKDDYLKLVKSKDFCQKLGLNSATLEGYLVPDTYFFQKINLEEVLAFLVNRQKEFLKSIHSNNVKNNLSDYKLLILASIIQSEAANTDEMPIISSVYHNRLQIGMRLQADPTILYDIYPRKSIRKSDLSRATPYNTYQISGLPPTPINSPSKEAIYAAANPANTNYLYFVLECENCKKHKFSSNYTNHQKNVNEYRKSTKK